MNEIQQFKKEIKQWRKEHSDWLAEVDFWVHQTQQLTALLYKLERSLPEHTIKLEQHVSLIMQHEHQQFSGQYKTQMMVFYQQAQRLMQQITQN